MSHHDRPLRLTRRRARPAVALAALLCVTAGCTSTAATDTAGVLPALATRPAVAAPVDAVVDPLGSPVADDRAVSATVMDGDVIEVPVGPEDRAFLLVLEADDAAELVGVSRVTDPTGDVRYWANLVTTQLLQDELHPRVLADAGAVSLYVTAPIGGELVPGPWRVEIATNDDRATATRTIISGDPTTARRLDLSVWVTADGIDGEALAREWRSGMDAVLTPHGIAVGNVDVRVAGEAGGAHRVIGVDGLGDDGHEACAAASAALGGSGGVPVVVAERIGEGVLTAAASSPAHDLAYRLPDGDLAGYAPASPGTPVDGPGTHACALVAVDEDLRARGLVALHEVLHVLGLTAHTTDSDGLVFDRFDDTAECPRGVHDADGDLRVSRDECAGLDAENLLFWELGGDRLSAEQAWRLRWHPALHDQ